MSVANRSTSFFHLEWEQRSLFTLDLYSLKPVKLQLDNNHYKFLEQKGAVDLKGNCFPDGSQVSDYLI